jgi:hypothetical protein
VVNSLVIFATAFFRKLVADTHSAQVARLAHMHWDAFSPADHRDMEDEALAGSRFSFLAKAMNAFASYTCLQLS